MTTKPSLAIISFSAIASDARLLKQIAALRDGFQLTVVGYGSRPEDVGEFIRIPDELVYWKYARRALILRAYRRAYWANPVVSHLASRLQGREFDAILANDVDTVGLALSLKPRGGVHADLHEYAPRQKEEVLRWRLFVGPFMQWLCRTYVARADSVTTVSGGLAREYERRFGFRAEVVTNASPFTDLDPRPVSSPIRLVHSGVCLRNRNIMALIDAVALARAKVTLDLFLTPNDPPHLRELRERAAEVGGVAVHDPVPYRELVSTLNEYDIGVFAGPPVNFNARWALPNKLFDYVQARLGVIVGPSPEMERVVEAHGLGVVTSGFSAADIATAYDRLAPETVAAWKRASDDAAHDLSAERQVAGWVEAIDRLVANVQPS